MAVSDSSTTLQWYRASTCFRFWSKTYTKRCTNTSLLSRDKTVSSLLEFIVTCFRFHNMFWKNISCFQFCEKTHTKRCTNKSCVKKDFLSLHFAVDQLLSISGYDLENGRMPCKQQYWTKDSAVKIPILILFWFCLLC